MIPGKWESGVFTGVHKIWDTQHTQPNGGKDILNAEFLTNDKLYKKNNKMSKKLLHLECFVPKDANMSKCCQKECKVITRDASCDLESWKLKSLTWKGKFEICI